MTMKNSERIARMHSRAGELKRQREKKTIAVWGSISLGLMAVLLLLVIRTERITQQVFVSRFAASSMLDENAGAYVLIAVIAFTAGVLVTSLIRWYRNRK